ncbi:MAG: type VI secretion system tip protein VgrG [Myxococcaceae bacterium]|nr:MAG: type VI secretion system tip protein VgrG [Myxococcaceae bacterium]
MSRQPTNPQHLMGALERARRSPLPEATFSFRVLSDDRWQVLRFEGREALSEGFEYTIELATADAAMGPEEFIDCAAELTIERDGHSRTVSGVVRAASDLGVAHGHRLARAVLVPELWCLSERFDSRVFVDRTAVELAREVLRLAELYVDRLEVQVTRSLPTHEYLVQYRESDLDFVKRWLEREGITFFVRHESGRGEVLVLSDHAEPWEETPTLDGHPALLVGPEGATHAAETFRSWQWERRATITSALVVDHDWTRPDYDPNAGRARPGRRVRRECASGLRFGGYDQGGSHAYSQDDAASQSALRMEGARSRSRVATATGNLTGLGAGQRLAVEGLDGDERAMLVVAVTHSGHAPEVLTERADGREDGERYANTAVCIPGAQRFRPERVTPWPRVSGVELARVEGPDPHAPSTECHGRVKVRFRWDERGESPSRESCFVPVVQAWAGARYGFTFVPRAGMEVAVDFVGGDPDRPIVVGALYNGENRHAEELPRHRSRSGIRTASLEDVTRYNELVFDDETHREEVFLRAQRNLREQVLSDHIATVGHDRTERIGHDHGETIGRDHRIHVGRDDDQVVEGMRDAVVHQHDTLTVHGNRVETVIGRESISAESRSVTVGHVEAQAVASGCQTVDVAVDHRMKVGQHITIEAGTSIKLKVGSTFLLIDHNGITLRGENRVTAMTHEFAALDIHHADAELRDAHGATVKLHGGFVRLNS